MMELGLVTLGDWLPDPATDRRVGQRERFREIVHLATRAEELGFTSFHVGEHHFSNYIVSSPAVLLAAIAERTSTVRLSTAVTLLPHLDPVRVAEDYASVDVLSAGRVEMIVGRGVYQDHYRYFGGSWDESDAMLTEAVLLLRELWSTDSVSWRGTIRPRLDGVTVQPRPIQQPHPPIWVSASSPASVQRAIALRCPIVIPTVSAGVDAPAALAAAFRSGWANAGHDPADARVGLHIHLFVGAGSTEEARQLWSPYQHAYLAWVLREVRGQAVPLPAAFEVRAGAVAQAICGDAEHVAAELDRRLDAIGGVDRLLIQCDQGGLPPNEAEACLERFATNVVPRLRQ